MSRKSKKAQADYAAIYGEQTRTTTPIITPEGVELPFYNASFGERLGALIIDFLIMITGPVILLIIWMILPFHEANNSVNAHISSAMDIFWLLLFFFIRSGYFIFFEMGPRAATPGKRLLKLRVISHDGGHLTPAAVFTRNALREVELYLPLTLMIVSLGTHSLMSWLAFFWALALICLPVFNKQHARLGDFLAGTRVVYMPKAGLSHDLVDLEGDRGLGLIFTTEQLSYGEMELSVLELVLRERQSSIMRSVAAKIKKRIDWMEPSSHVPSDENFLRAYYGALRAHLEGRMLLGKRRKDKNAVTP